MAGRERLHRNAIAPTGAQATGAGQDEDGLTDLTGTDKQVAWAVTIRQELLAAEMDGIIGECVAVPDTSRLYVRRWAAAA